jgi:hypothetical protein
MYCAQANAENKNRMELARKSRFPVQERNIFLEPGADAEG